MSDKTIEKQLKETAEELLELMGLTAKVSVETDIANEALVVQIETEEAGILIGRHGETISALQLILNQIISTKLKKEDPEAHWPRIVVNCGDYLERQEESLRSIALNSATAAKETGEAQTIYDLTPAQRRIVHMALAEDPEIETASEGIERDRHLVITAVKK